MTRFAPTTVFATSTASFVREGVSGNRGITLLAVSLLLAVPLVAVGAVAGAAKLLGKLSRGLSQSRLDWSGYSVSYPKSDGWRFAASADY